MWVTFLFLFSQTWGFLAFPCGPGVPRGFLGSLLDKYSTRSDCLTTVLLAGSAFAAAVLLHARLLQLWLLTCLPYTVL